MTLSERLRQLDEAIEDMTKRIKLYNEHLVWLKSFDFIQFKIDRQQRKIVDAHNGLFRLKNMKRRLLINEVYSESLYSWQKSDLMKYYDRKDNYEFVQLVGEAFIDNLDEDKLTQKEYDIITKAINYFNEKGESE